MVVRIFLIILLFLIADRTEAKQDSTSTSHANKIALRFGIQTENMLQTLGGKYWLREDVALSIHFAVEYNSRFQNSSDPSYIFSQTQGFIGFMMQGEYHLHSIKNVISISKDISPYTAISIGAGIELGGSWYAAAGIALGAEVFLNPSISLALEQGVDISYRHKEIYEPTNRFTDFFQFAKLRNYRALLHIYF